MASEGLRGASEGEVQTSRNRCGKCVPGFSENTPMDGPLVTRGGRRISLFGSVLDRPPPLVTRLTAR